MEQDKPRARKAHRKSRDGCLACKKRGTRCDEGKPICNRCLVRGIVCDYVVRNQGSAHQQPLRMLMPSRIEFDPFDCLPVKWAKRSLEIFHHFNRFRLLAQTKVPSEYVQGILAQDPICYHNGLVMAAMHYSWLCSSYNEIEETYLFHKLEIIRAVNKSIAESTTMAKTGIIEAINSLSLAEAGVGEITASDLHLNGLATVFEQANHGERQHYQSYREISQHLMLIMGSFVGAAKMAGREGGFSMHFYLCPNEESSDPKTKAQITPSFTPSYNRHLTPTLIPNSSAAWATASYLYLNIIFFDGEWIPGGPGNRHLLRWLLDWVRAKHEDGHEAATRGNSGEVWLWRVVIGAYALTVACSSSAVRTVDENIGEHDEEQSEMAKISAWYTEQLYKRGQVTWTSEWEAANEVLEKIQWLQTPGSNGELILERVWRDSARDSGDY